MTQSDLYLASQSPRRQELLEQLSINYTILAADVDETVHSGETADHYVSRLARQKALASWHSEQRVLDIPVLGADTAILLDDSILGKPTDREDALRMLGAMSNRAHTVLTAICVCQDDKIVQMTSETLVYFRKINTIEAEAYWESGEPADKAGAYAIQGLGAVFVQRIEGSYSGVMGLPLFETVEALKQFNIFVIGAP
jgi:septum formation protein